MIFCIHNEDTLNICMKEFGSQKLIIDEITVINENLTIFQLVLNRAYEKMIAIEILTIFSAFIEQDSAYMGRSTPTTGFDGLT